MPALLATQGDIEGAKVLEKAMDIMFLSIIG
jgi:hypothetical protein